MSIMTIVYIILALVLVVNGAFGILFARDLAKNRGTVMKEPGNPIALAILSPIIFFFSTFGISDFAVASAIYPKLKWVDPKRLPGTLNTQCAIPVAFMALFFIRTIEVGIWTLVIAIAMQIIGSYVSPRFVVKLPAKQIKIFISIGLLIASVMITFRLIGFMPSGENMYYLTGWRLAVLAIAMFVFGALNNLGIGSYSLTMAAVYALGLSPAIAFPIMMGACTFSVPVGGMEFLRFENSYSRKITLFTSTFGILGVLLATRLYGQLNLYHLTLVVIAVIFYSAVTMIMSVVKDGKAEADEEVADVPEEEEVS